MSSIRVVTNSTMKSHHCLRQPDRHNAGRGLIKLILRYPNKDKILCIIVHITYRIIIIMLKQNYFYDKLTTTLFLINQNIINFNKIILCHRTEVKMYNEIRREESIYHFPSIQFQLCSYVIIYQSTIVCIIIKT